MLQDLWNQRQRLMAALAELDVDDDDQPATLLSKVHCGTDCAIADIVPQTLEECLIHARLLANVYCDPHDSRWGEKQDTRLAKSLLSGLERLARKG